MNGRAVRVPGPGSSGAARIVAAVAVLLWLVGCAHAEPVPLVHAHAHNDYEHRRPLNEALDCGFCSVEADIHLVNGQLLVAHDLKKTTPARTLQKLYLDPLRDRVRRNGGRVYRGGPTVTLLVDIKSEPESTYAALREVLKGYADMLTRFDHGRKKDGAVTVVLTGNVPRATVAAEPARLVACDGTLPDLDATPPPPADLVVQVNGRWTDVFAWRGQGPIPAADRARLRGLADEAHAQGRLIRFWDAPDHEAAWAEMRADGVDLINTDRLEACRDFLRRAIKLSRGGS